MTRWITPKTWIVLCSRGAVKESIWHASNEASLSIKSIFLGKFSKIWNVDWTLVLTSCVFPAGVHSSVLMSRMGRTRGEKKREKKTLRHVCDQAQEDLTFACMVSLLGSLVGLMWTGLPSHALSHPCFSERCQSSNSLFLLMKFVRSGEGRASGSRGWATAPVIMSKEDLDPWTPWHLMNPPSVWHMGYL